MQEQNQKLQKLNSELSELLNILPNTEELLSKMSKEGIGFMRLHVASPRCIIEKAMKQLADAYQLYIKWLF